MDKTDHLLEYNILGMDVCHKYFSFMRTSLKLESQSILDKLSLGHDHNRQTAVLCDSLCPFI